MKSIDMKHIIAWSGGRVLSGPATGNITSISTDTRTLKPGSCFVPLIGERFDGHTFIREALRRGARAILCDQRFKPESVGSLLDGKSPNEGPTFIAVQNTLNALQAIAQSYRLTFDVPVVAVTGSNGKTTTKEYLTAILHTDFPVAATEGNLNNHIGVPLTLFSLNDEVGAIVVEMGMNAPGEIGRLAEIARPDVGIVTNVGPVHIENFRDIQSVAHEKSALVRSLPKDGIAVLNADDPLVFNMKDQTDAKVITFGLSQEADIRADKIDLRGIDGVRFQLLYCGERFPVTLKLPGPHQVYNALSAAAATLAMGLMPSSIQEGLLSVRRTPMRMHAKRLAGDVTLIDDAYNASPLSMRAAIDTMVQTYAKRRIAVLAGMLELGTESESLHRTVGKTVARAGIDRLIAIGGEGQWMAEAAADAGMPKSHIVWSETVDQATPVLSEMIQSGDLVLVKGSRGYQLETLVRSIEQLTGYDDEGGPPNGSSQSGKAHRPVPRHQRVKKDENRNSYIMGNTFPGAVNLGSSGANEQESETGRHW